MAAPPTTAKSQKNDSPRPSAPGQISSGKKECAKRAAWRVAPGKPPERLSPHYRLDCEFGSLLMQSWKNEGYEPIYVCEEHARQFGEISEPPPPARKTPAPKPRVAPAKKPAAAPRPAQLPRSPEVSAPEPPPVAAVAPISTSPAVAVPTLPELLNVESFPAIRTEQPAKISSPTASPRSAPSSPRASKQAGAFADRCDMVNRMIYELTTQLEIHLSEAEAAMSVAEFIDVPLEMAMQEIISRSTIPDAEKDAAVQRLGTLQESLKHGLPVEIRPLKAYRLKQIVKHCLTNDVNMTEAARPGYLAVHDSLESAIYASASKAKHLEERLANLQGMKAELDNLG